MRRFQYSLVWCNLVNCIGKYKIGEKFDLIIYLGILNEALGASLDLSVEEICRFSSILKKNEMVLHKCDPLERPLALITTEGKWEQETDNSQGSFRIRYDISLIFSISLLVTNRLKNIQKKKCPRLTS